MKRTFIHIAFVSLASRYGQPAFFGISTVSVDNAASGCIFQFSASEWCKWFFSSVSQPILLFQSDFAFGRVCVRRWVYLCLHMHIVDNVIDERCAIGSQHGISSHTSIRQTLLFLMFHSRHMCGLCGSGKNLLTDKNVTSSISLVDEFNRIWFRVASQQTKNPHTDTDEKKRKELCGILKRYVWCTGMVFEQSPTRWLAEKLPNTPDTFIRWKVMMTYDLAQRYAWCGVSVQCNASDWRPKINWQCFLCIRKCRTAPNK